MYEGREGRLESREHTAPISEYFGVSALVSMATFPVRRVRPLRQSRRMFRPMRSLLLAGNAIVERFPIKHRGTQIAIDSMAAAAAVVTAYQLRFDFNLPANYARGMWFWTVAMAILRPAALRIFTGYKSIWRFLRLQDLMNLAFASLPASLLLLTLRLSMRQVSWIADVPRGVVALEFAMFAGFAMGVRGLRRAAYEETRLATAKHKRALVLGTEETLASALAQLR